MTTARDARSWDFPYAPVPTAAGDDDGEACDVVVATFEPLTDTDARRALEPLLETLDIETLLSRAPIFWTRIRSPNAVRRAAVLAALRDAGVRARYVASATRFGVGLGEPLDFDGAAAPARPTDWATRARREPSTTSGNEVGMWFLGANGLAVDRARCGQGEGTRLAVIDDDFAEIDELCVDREIAVGLEAPPRATSHGSLMAAWAVGCSAANGFAGVAPAASPRLYCIPKPGIDVTSLPLAVARAVFDGADVVLCATYVEGHTSPMLDDALEVARRLGRGGLGAAVVFPTGREASSPAGSIHSSWSLALGDAASDPRVFCVAPSARSGGWFLWSDRKGRLRPFANRGPAVRWLAPGDDIAYPFGKRQRLFHAESSGASALAAGVLLLVLAKNPELHVTELDAIVTRTVTEVSPVPAADARPLADRFDVLPLDVDADGHNAKHGYGRLNATRACAAAEDPLLFALVSIGEEDAARAVAALLGARRPYSPALARFAARKVLADASLSHAVRALVRHARLVATEPSRRAAQAEGALTRQLTILLRDLERQGAPAEIAAELSALRAKLDERAILDAASRVFAQARAAAPALFDTLSA